jgi:alpha-L-fucosidase
LQANLEEPAESRIEKESDMKHTIDVSKQLVWIARVCCAGFLAVVVGCSVASSPPQVAHWDKVTSAADLVLPVADGPFQPAPESLTQYQYPDWFRDAKFGIWAHWGPQAVPMEGDWYARKMYQQGQGDYNDHLQRWGHPSEHGYKDIIPLWKAEKWDPDRLMQLYKRAGAKYFVSMGSHHDNFFLWNSKLHRWNAVQMGPHRDVVGEWQKAAKKYGLKFGVSEHLGASFTWFQDSHKSDRTGPLAGVPYDGANPEYQDLYHFPAEPNDRGWYSRNPRWQQQWYDEIQELVDNYHPDLLYTDGGVPFGNIVGYSMIAHLYNDSAARNDGRAQVVYTCKQKSGGRWVEDLERGIMPQIDPYPWQTDTSIGDWFYNKNWKFRPVSWVIYMLVDNVSKNGNLLLNVVQRPDGSLDPEVEQMLEELAKWNAVFGEAIYGTRPWLVYGESYLKAARRRRFEENYQYNAKEIRFTTKGSTLYAFTLGWPEDRRITIRSLAKPEGSDVNRIERISLLGYNGKIEWQQTPDGLTVTLPEQKVSEYTAALKIEGSALTNVPFVAAVSVASPNSTIEVEVRTDANNQLTWSVKRENQTVLAPAPLGLTVDGHDLGRSITFGEPRTRTIDEQYATWGNHSTAVNRCNEAVIPVTCADGTTYELEVRAFDDGAAVRSRVPLDDTTHTIAGEATSFALPPDSHAWWARYDNGYEKPCDSGTLETMPANRPLAPPVTFRLGGDLYVSLTEANNDSFPDMGLERDGSLLKAVFPASAKGWSQQGPIVTPWRVAIIAEGLNALVNSDIVTNLCPPPPAELANADWIKPGRSLWQWWAIGAPRLDDQKEWVDAAKTLGFEYYLIDEGWRNWRAPDKDQWQCLKEVIDYAKTQGVGCLVWVNSSEMRSAARRRAYLERVASLGAVGIKIDFIPACTAAVTRWYEGALKDTAELHLLCNFHGAVKPTGRRRTWPHELTREAVRGHEYHMTRYRRIQTADHDEIVLFTRFLAGPADYTPTAFDLKEMVGYTWAHLLAQAVDMTSPLLHFAGGYQDFIGNPAEDLLRHLPSTWDETIVLPGSEIGKTVGFARRRGQEWYIGVLNGAEAATLPIDLSFLGQGAWQAEVFGDDPDNAAAFKRDSKTVTPEDKLTISMSPRGGAVVWITRDAG